MDNTLMTPRLVSVDFDPFSQGAIEKTVRLTESQQEIWTSCLIGGAEANCAYNESISLVLQGDFLQEAMSRALSDVVTRHEALRSSISANGESMCIHADANFLLHIEDLSMHEAFEQHTLLEAHAADDAEKPFDLKNGPLFRAAIFKLSEHKHHVRLTAHHVVCDGWSFGIILEDLAVLYSAHAQSVHPDIQAPTGFAEYVAYLTDFNASDEYVETENYWIGQYKKPYSPIEIPIDFPRSPQRTYRSDRVDFLLDKPLVEGLSSMGKAHNASLVTVLLTAFEAYMHRLSSQEDIVIGLAASGQLASGYNNLVGHCVHLLPIRSTPSGNVPYTDYLRRRSGEIMDAYDHQQLTLGKLLQKIQVERDSSQIPLTPFVFNVDISMGEQVSFHGLQHQLLFNPRHYENFEIFLNVTRSRDSLVLEWSYNTQLFKKSTIQRMMAEYESLLNHIAQTPEQAIAKLNILTESQLAQLDNWNETTQDLGEDASFIALFEQTASQYADRTAVTFQTERLTFGELDKRSNQFANALIESGIRQGDKVGIVLDRSADLIIALIGVMKTGAIYLPFDVSLPSARASDILEEVGADFLLTTRAYQNAYIHPGKVLCIETLLESASQHSESKPDISIDGDDLVYILHTSGSTGKPKGVQILHRNMVNFLRSMQLYPGISNQDRVLAITPLSFDMAVVLYLPLISGSELVLADVETSKDGRLLHEVLVKKQISWMIATPSTWEMTIAAGWDERLDFLAISAGEALNPKLAEQLLQRCTSVWNGYGPTETTVMVLMKEVESADQPITLGKPLANTKIYILDPYGNRVPAGHHGEIHIAGANIGAGYYNRPELTRQNFVHNPFSPHPKESMYRTGDLGMFAENGEIQYLGRIDNQVKIRGHRIELGEIEHVLINQRGIKDTVVLAVDDHKGDKTLVAYVVQDDEDATGWKDRWEDLYELGVKSEEDVPLEQQNLDIAIISQYYTSDDIEEQGAEWTQEGLKRIKALNAKKIIELGTGGGHLLLTLGPEVDEYVATDYSEVAINKLNEKLAVQPEKWEHVRAYTAMADDFSGLAPHAYDLVFLHGVAQYFPSLRYLQKVIENATQALKDGGCIYIGDMQTLGAISMHFYLDQLDITNESTTVKEFREITELRIRKEEELSVDPDFFYQLPSRIPAITSVDVQIRGGNYLNEGTKCHYDIWLYVGDTAPKTTPATIELRWDIGSTPQKLASELSRHAGQIVSVKQIPNSRLSRDFALLQFINQADDQTTIGKLKSQMKPIGQSGANPSELWAIGEQAGFHTHLRWATDGSDGYIEAVFIPAHLNTLPEPPNAGSTSSATLSGDRLETDIKILAFPEHQIKKWKSGLQAKLPDYMVPTRYIALNRLPLSANGKIDRKKLPRPELNEEFSSANSHKAAATETERIVHGIWSKFLEVEEISITHNFFELGGHSLIAVKIMLEIEKTTGSRLPISSLFEHSTIEKLARVIDNATDPISWDCVIPIRPEGNKPPLYVIHGALLDILYVRNLLPFLHDNQPLYGIQGMGLSGKSLPAKRVEEIAAHYLSEVLTHTSKGPIALAGYSSGGIIAFEMAKQLTKQGVEVCFVGLLDTYTAKPRFGLIENIDFWNILLKEAGIQYGKMRTLSFLLYSALAKVSSKSARYLSKKKALNAFLSDYNKFKAQVAHFVAHKNYKLAPFNVETFLFKSMEEKKYGETNGWPAYISDEQLRTIHISGSHVNMFRPNQVEGTARALQKALGVAGELHRLKVNSQKTKHLHLDLSGQTNTIDEQLNDLHSS